MEDKFKSSVEEAEKDPMTEWMVLRLEDPPVITKYLHKGKSWYLAMKPLIRHLVMKGL